MALKKEVIPGFGTGSELILKIDGNFRHSLRLELNSLLPIDSVITPKKSEIKAQNKRFRRFIGL